MNEFKFLDRSFLFRLHFKISNFSDLFTVKGGTAMVDILKGMFIIADAKVTSGRIRLICRFVWLVKHLLRTQGPKGTVVFLKATGVSLQQALGGQKVGNATLLGTRFARTRTGYPRFIPAQIRTLIRQGSGKEAKLILTLINVFRVFEFPGTLKLRTITEPSKGHGGLNDSLYAAIPRFVRLFVTERGWTPNRILRFLDRAAMQPVRNLWKSGPGVISAFGQYNTHPVIMLRQLVTLKGYPRLWDALEVLWSYMPPVFWEARDVSLALLDNWAGLVKPIPYIGKLGTKAEAAGKIRVFAMVDAWTQWTLKPLHRLYFSILKDVPMDGTFDQIRPARALVKETGGLYSLDLSAATDRLPVSLQQALLGAIVGHDFAAAWRNLLVGRVYRLHGKNKSFDDLTYAVGQPMGALSSWASLAIVHHFIVQCAAWRAGHPISRLYRGYAILGDDIIIKDPKVVREYLRILNSLGVECGLHKSIMSPKGLAAEFAKRTFYKGQDVSPVPVKEFYAATHHLGAAVEMRKKYSLSISQMLQALGVGWQVRSWLNKPLGKLSARVRLFILACSLPTNLEEVKAFFSLGAPKVALYRNETLALMQELAPIESGRLMNSLFSHAGDVTFFFDPKTWADDTARKMIMEAAKIPEEDLIYPEPLDPEEQVGFVDMTPPRPLLPEAWRPLEWCLGRSLQSLLEVVWFNSRSEIKEDADILLERLSTLSPANFEEYYLGILEISQQAATRDLNPFSTVRPNPPKVPGLQTPAQVRFWKRWSAKIQGSAPLKIRPLRGPRGPLQFVMLP